MKDDIIDLSLTTSAILIPIIGQVVAPPESFFTAVSNLTGFGLCAILLLYINFYRDPRVEKERKEERLEMLTAFRAERTELISSFQRQMDEKRKDYLTDVKTAREEFLAQLSEERASFEAMLQKFACKAIQ